MDGEKVMVAWEKCMDVNASCMGFDSSCFRQLRTDILELVREYKEELKSVKLESYKEFAERLKVYGYQPFNWNRYVVDFRGIDKCFNEMERELNDR